MAKEITTYDDKARLIYDIVRKKTDPHFDQIKRKERDFWRARAQLESTASMVPDED